MTEIVCRLPPTHRSRALTLWLGAVLAAALALIAASAGTARAADPITVSQAIAGQDSASQTVRGYIVGEPVATGEVGRSNFANNYAIALADNAAETDTDRMLYIQLTAQWRSAWGLKSNPANLGRRVDITGPLTAYFSHPGLKSPSAIANDGSTPTPTATPTPTPTGSNAGDYYAEAEGKTGAELEAALNEIISEQRVLTYSQVWDALKDTDQDPSNPANVIELYTGDSNSKSNNGGGSGQWNREHVWPKSHGGFGTAPGPGTDVHHLRPSDVGVNGARGNLDFDNGGGPVSNCGECGRDGDSFEPPDRVKGDVARMIFYMSVRYEGGDGWADLEVNDRVGNGSAPNVGKLSVLKQWHQGDSPDAFEKRRNERIFEQWQGNRNPFIDRPEFVEAIWGP